MQDTVEIILAKSVLREGTSSSVCFRKIYSWTQTDFHKNINQTSLIICIRMSVLIFVIIVG